MFSAQAFISYSHSQFYFAESLVASLAQQGIPTWFDNRNITPGSHWNETLSSGLGRSSHFVLIASRESLSSSYVSHEWQAAIAQGKRIIIAYFEGVDLPPELQRYPQISFQGNFDQAATRLVDVLRYDRMIKEQPIKTWLPNGDKRVFASLVIVGAITALLMSTIAIVLLVVIFQLDNLQQEAINSLLQSPLPGLKIKVSGNLYVEHFFHSASFLLYGIIGSSLFFLVVLLIRRQRLNFASLLRSLQIVPGVLGLATLLVILAVKQPPALIGWTIFVLVVAFAIFGIWISRRARHSPDVLRWMPTGSAPDDMRKQSTFPHIFTPVPPENLPLRRWQLLSANDADARAVSEIRDQLLRTTNLRESNNLEADWRVVILGSQTPASWVEKYHRYQPNTVYVITSNIRMTDLGPEVQASQWFDFRNIDNSESLAAFLSQGYAGNTLTPTPTSVNTFRLSLGVENIYVYLLGNGLGFGIGFISSLVLFLIGYTRNLGGLGFTGIMLIFVNPLLSLLSAAIFTWLAYKLLHRDITLVRFLVFYLGLIALWVAAVIVLILGAAASTGSTNKSNDFLTGLLLLIAILYGFTLLALPAIALFALVWFRKAIRHWLPQKISPQPTGQLTIALRGWYLPRFEAFIVGGSLLLGVCYILASVFAPTFTLLK